MESVQCYYSSVTTFQKNNGSERLKVATSYYSGNEYKSDKAKVFDYTNYVAVVQPFLTMEEAYKNVYSMRNGMYEFDKSRNRIVEV